MRANEALTEYIDALFLADPKKAREIVREIKSRCEYTSAVYSNKRRGLTPIKKPERNEINEIVGFNLFKNVTN